MWFGDRSDTNRPVQAQKRARSLKFRMQEEEELYYPSSENKGADKLRGYREADLRLCFRICRLLVFPRGGSSINLQILNIIHNNNNYMYSVMLEHHRCQPLLDFIVCLKENSNGMIKIPIFLLQTMTA